MVGLANPERRKGMGVLLARNRYSLSLDNIGQTIDDPREGHSGQVTVTADLVDCGLDDVHELLSEATSHHIGIRSLERLPPGSHGIWQSLGTPVGAAGLNLRSGCIVGWPCPLPQDGLAPCLGIPLPMTQVMLYKVIEAAKRCRLSVRIFDVATKAAYAACHATPSAALTLSSSSHGALAALWWVLTALGHAWHTHYFESHSFSSPDAQTVDAHQA